ncbi:MAG: PilZ domain-containing protein [Erythrobacter sp.]|uniref:PilZ domain-containing protein n=1 Tax=Erythrobacter sp. TaxID=1042 RepID=UPI00260F2188|nr:PilZ domain-containing protein [Erythrobacter sp.]MDJ0978644.1 PilZ domain-containing protein [Erythrobacter sp.]
MSGSLSSLVRLPLGGIPFVAPRPDADEEPLANVGRRRAARLRLSIPAKLVTLSETRRCVLLDISRTGAQINLSRPLGVGEAGLLQFADYELFVSAIRAATGRNGLEFDAQIADEDVLEIRRFADTFELDQRRALLREAQQWATGRAAA